MCKTKTIVDTTFIGFDYTQRKATDSKVLHVPKDLLIRSAFSSCILHGKRGFQKSLPIYRGPYFLPRRANPEVESTQRVALVKEMLLESLQISMS